MCNRTKLVYLALATCAVLMPRPASAAFTVTYNFSGQPGNQTSSVGVVASSPAGGVTGVTDIARGTGITPNIGANSINAAGFSTAGIDLTDYYGFSITPGAGFALDLGTLTFSDRRSGTGARSISVRTSLDGFAADIFTAALPNNTLTQRHSFAFGPAFDSVSTPLTIRLYGYNADGVGGTWRLGESVASGDNPSGFPANLVLDGVAVPTPLPPTALLAVAVPFLVGFGRRAINRRASSAIPLAATA